MAELKRGVGLSRGLLSKRHGDWLLAMAAVEGETVGRFSIDGCGTRQMVDELGTAASLQFRESGKGKHVEELN